MDHGTALLLAYLFTAVLLCAEVVMLGVRRRAAWRTIRGERLAARAAADVARPAARPSDGSPPADGPDRSTLQA